MAASKKTGAVKRATKVKRSAPTASMSSEMVTLMVWTFTLLSVLFFVLAVVQYA